MAELAGEADDGQLRRHRAAAVRRGTVVEIVYRIRHEPPGLEGLKRRLRGLVEACTAKQPGRRLPARALLLELLGDHAEPDPQAAGSANAPAARSDDRPHLSPG